MLRFASWAARMVPENPPPIMATGTRPSDFIIGPVGRIGGTGFARLDMIVDAGDGPAGGFREPAGDDGVDHRRASGADQLRGNLRRAEPVTAPRHAERMRMLGEQAPQRRRLLVRDVLLF